MTVRYEVAVRKQHAYRTGVAQSARTTALLPRRFAAVTSGSAHGATPAMRSTAVLEQCPPRSPRRSPVGSTNGATKLSELHGTDSTRDDLAKRDTPHVMT